MLPNPLPRLAHAIAHSRLVVAADRSAEDLVVQTTRSFQAFSCATTAALGRLTATAADAAFQATTPVRQVLLRHRRPLETAIAALAGTADVMALTVVIAVDGRRFLQAFIYSMNELFHPVFEALEMTRSDDYEVGVRDTIVLATLGYVVLGRLSVFGQRDVVAIGRHFAGRVVRQLGAPA